VTEEPQLDPPSFSFPHAASLESSEQTVFASPLLFAQNENTNDTFVNDLPQDNFVDGSWWWLQSDFHDLMNQPQSLHQLPHIASADVSELSSGQSYSNGRFSSSIEPPAAVPLDPSANLLCVNTGHHYLQRTPDNQLSISITPSASGYGVDGAVDHEDVPSQTKAALAQNASLFW
jgi:hypothetical protein